MPYWNPDPRIKPRCGSHIRWDHPLAKGLVGCWLFNEGAGASASNLVTSQGNATLVDTVAYCPNGIRVTNPGSGSGYTGVRIPAYPKLLNALTPAYSLVGRTTPVATTLNDGIFAGKAGVGTVDDIVLGVISTTGNLFLQTLGATSPYIQTAWTRGSSQSFAATVDANNYGRLYVQGVFGAGGALALLTPSATSFCIGNYSGDYSTVYNGDIEWFGVYSRALSANEVAQLYYEPYCMIEWPGASVWRYYSIPAAPAGNPWYAYAQQ